MAVVINELEVVVESQTDSKVAGRDPQPVPPPAELDDVADRRALYAARVQAH